MKVLPPGTLLQIMYLRERIRQIKPGRFIEIGPGSGEITQLLLDNGWAGYSYDLEVKTIMKLKDRFAKEIVGHRFEPINADYLISPLFKKVDLVISSMVMEHLDDNAQINFMRKSAGCLNNDGLMIGLVPASHAHWGIEDDIAGHYRRYTRSEIKKLVDLSSWKLLHIVGLTFPVSNFLLPVSNFLVNRSERSKLGLSLIERTKQSGNRKVMLETYFPSLLRIFLNEIVLFPFHVLQKLYSNSEHALVLYFEAQPYGE